MFDDIFENTIFIFPHVDTVFVDFDQFGVSVFDETFLDFLELAVVPLQYGIQNQEEILFITDELFLLGMSENVCYYHVGAVFFKIVVLNLLHHSQ